ncbi:MAG: hypothetical protein AAGF60_11215 [Pseudomonadota bacterium]
MTGRKYDEAWVSAVIDAARVSYCALNLLQMICRARDFQTGQVAFTKDQLIERSGYGRTRTKAALIELRRIGVLVPLEDDRGRTLVGGRGQPARYQIVLLGQGGQSAASAPEGETPRPMDMAEFSRIQRQDGTAAAFAAKKAWDDAERDRCAALSPKDGQQGA